MPAGPAPTTATRSGRDDEGAADGGGAAPSADTTRILSWPGPFAPDPPRDPEPGARSSAAGDVVVQVAGDVLAEHDVAVGHQRVLLAGVLGLLDGHRSGEPAAQPGQDAVLLHVADDL